jgi:hypothetical protein
MAEPFHNGYALLIGVGGDLPATIKDAEALAGVLRDPLKAGYPDEQVWLLTGPAATRDKVETAFEQLDARLTNDQRDNATVLVYYSGHGGYDSDAAGAYYLLTHGYDLADLGGSALPGQRFSERLETLGRRAKKLIVIVDACHAGEIKAAAGRALRARPERLLHQLDQGGGRVVIASSLDSQVSMVGANGLSVFTECLLEALEGKNTPPKNAYVSFADVWEHLGLEVPRRAKTLGREQTPLVNVKDGTFFFLARNAEGKPENPTLFVDYAPADVDFVQPLIEQLDFLRAAGLIAACWERRQILFGNVYQQIDERLKNAHIFLELRGPSFLAYQEAERADREHSAYPRTALQTAIDRRMPRIPIILRSHLYKFDPAIKQFGLKVYPEKNGQVVPVDNWSNPADAYAGVAEKIAAIVEAMNY